MMSYPILHVLTRRINTLSVATSITFGPGCENLLLAGSLPGWQRYAARIGSLIYCPAPFSKKVLPIILIPSIVYPALKNNFQDACTSRAGA